MVQSKSVLSVSTEMKVGNSGYENISIEFFGTSVHEYFDHLSWHLVDRKFTEKMSSDVMTESEEECTGNSNCYVQLQLPTGLHDNAVTDFCNQLDKYWNQKNFFMINFINELFEAWFWTLTHTDFWTQTSKNRSVAPPCVWTQNFKCIENDIGSLSCSKLSFFDVLI